MILMQYCLKTRKVPFDYGKDLSTSDEGLVHFLS